MKSLLPMYLLALVLISRGECCSQVQSEKDVNSDCAGQTFSVTSSSKLVDGDAGSYATALQTSSKGSYVSFPLGRVEVYERENIIMASLVQFLLRQTSQSQVIIVHDGFLPGVFSVVRSCQDAMIDTIILEYEADLILFEGILKSNFFLGDMRNVMLLCSPENIISIFETVRERSLESPSVSWLAVLEDDVTETLQSSLREGTQVAVAVQVTDSSYRLLTSYVGIDNLISFRPIGKWNALASTRTTVDEDVLLASNITETRIHGVSMATWWSLKEPLFPSLNSLYDDFLGRNLVVTVVSNDPYFKLKYLDNGTAVPDYGIDAEVMSTLSRRLNFTYSILEPDDGRWGGPEADGTISGMIGMVANHRAHLAIDEITITSTRESVVDFTRPYYLEATTLVSRAPSRKDPTLAIFQPFSPLIWGLLIIMTLIIGPIGFTITKCHEQFYPKHSIRQHYGAKMEDSRQVVQCRDDGSAIGTAQLASSLPPPISDKINLGIGVPPGRRISMKQRPSSLSYYSFNMFRSLVVQGNLIVTEQASVRIILIFWYIFCLIVYSLYAGTLTAFMTIPAFETPIDSLDDLVKANKDGFVPAVQPGTSNERVFKAAKSGIFKELWDLTEHPRSFPSSGPLALDMVLTDDIVYMSANLNLEIRTSQKGRHRFYLARQTFFPQGYGIACRTGAPYKQKFDEVLVRMLQAGLVNKWVRDEVGKLNRAGGSREVGKDRRTESLALSINHLQAAFFLLLAGSLLSFGVFLLELLQCYCKSKELILE